MFNYLFTFYVCVVYICVHLCGRVYIPVGRTEGMSRILLYHFPSYSPDTESLIEHKVTISDRLVDQYTPRIHLSPSHHTWVTGVSGHTQFLHG